jgi:hypothetical protein
MPLTSLGHNPSDGFNFDDKDSLQFEEPTAGSTKILENHHPQAAGAKSRNDRKLTSDYEQERKHFATHQANMP